ncbi:DUF55-domain-containing protein [Neurospora crassa]|nr:DUF55-domain-containing protein [Neurospora crassa]
MPKRKSTHAESEPEQATRRRSSRLSKGVEPTEEVMAPVKEEKPQALSTGKKGGRKPAAVKEEEENEEKKVEPSTTTTTTTTTDTPARQYWLLKAEPLPRLENGYDVHFSIDDLAARTSPEPWDGIRNYSARNNLRSMRVGDLAFFYHSNCANPGIVGVMEIVREAEEDWTAVDPKAAYFDPKAKKAKEEGKENPWSLVHVEFREKFERELGLKELREWGKGGGPLEGMELLRLGRLSVSRVGEEEWEFLMDKAGGRTGR